MATSRPDRIVCQGCGRSGPFRAELVGKRIKCKCGYITRVTAPEPPVEVEAEPAPSEPLVTAEEERGLHGVDSEGVAPVQEERPAQTRAGRYEVIKIAGLGLHPDPSKAAGKTGSAIRLSMIIGAFALVVVLAVAGIKMFGWRAPAKALPGEDAVIERKIDTEYNKEIHAWFREDPSRLLGPWTRAQALKQADLWQKDGAKRVLAFGTAMSLVAVIELPDDPAQRKVLFDWQATWHKAHFEKVWTDVGQKYLMIRLGI